MEEVETSYKNMYIASNTKMQSHKRPGIDYLISIGYKKEDIGDVGHLGEPDLVTIDDKYWEVKNLMAGRRIIFTYDQLMTFNDNVNIIIFGGEYSSSRLRNFIECIKYGDIKKKCNGDESIKFKRDYKIFIHKIIELKEALETEKINTTPHIFYGYKRCFDPKQYKNDGIKNMKIPEGWKKLELDIPGSIYYKQTIEGRLRVKMIEVKESDKQSIMNKIWSLI